MVGRKQLPTLLVWIGCELRTFFILAFDDDLQMGRNAYSTRLIRFVPGIMWLFFMEIPFLWQPVAHGNG